MLGRFACIAAAVVLVGLSSAQAADETLTLTCQGTMTEQILGADSVSMGIVVNFTDRTVQGLTIPGGLIDYPIKITGWNDVTVSFSGSKNLDPTVVSMTGTIDRVTGDLEATSTQTLGGISIGSTTYSLKCRPAKRLF
jgi:hypothetical protein